MRGEGSIYTYMQDGVRPETSNIARDKERINILCGMDIIIDGNKAKVLRWRQEKVKHTIEALTLPTVMVDWDKMEDVTG